MLHQISIFDEEPLTKFEQAMQRGSNIVGGKHRIYGASINLSVSELADFLKEEYGWSGSSFLDGFVTFSPKGIEIWKWEPRETQTYSWMDAAKAVKKLISLDKYLTSEEKEYMKSLQEEFDGIPLPKARYGYGEGWA